MMHGSAIQMYIYERNPRNVLRAPARLCAPPQLLDDLTRRPSKPLPAHRQLT